MTKKSKTPDAVMNIALIVFGRDTAKRPHAGTFTKDDAELAERAAAMTGMKVLRVATEQHRAVAIELTPGRVHASGSAHLPFCAKGSFERVEALDGAFQPSVPQAVVAAPVHPHMPTWANIEKGSVVLAADEIVWGWYEAEVIDAKGDMFECRWVLWPDQPTIIRRGEHLAIMSAAALAAFRGQAASES